MGLWDTISTAVKDKHAEVQLKIEAYAREYQSKSTEELKRICDKEVGAKCGGAQRVLKSRGIDY